jgi:glycosyltransferase involved in cell wall biosynthesis
VQVSVAVGRDGPLLARLPAGTGRVVPFARRNDIAAIENLRRLVSDLHVDIVHTHSPLAGIFGRHAALRAGRAIVHTLHGVGILDELARAVRVGDRLKLTTYRWHERWLNGRSAAVIAVSPRVAARVLAARHVPQRRLTIIPNGIGPRPAVSAGEVKPLIAYAGRLHEEKGPADLVRAFGRVRSEIPDARLRLIGDGPLRSEIEALVLADGLAAQVEMTGEIPDIGPALDGAACLVLPSHAEGLSYVLLEAMARGIPCIATRVGGTPDLIEDGRTGRLVPPRAPAELAREIVALLRDPGRARTWGENARREVRERFTLEQMVAATALVYRAIDGGPRPMTAGGPGR